MNEKNKKFCFCTYAGGTIYRSLAKNLINDLKNYAPNTPFIILTDKPKDFDADDKVLVFKHKRQGVLFYHERRFAIAKALSMFQSCMYLDADVRICAPVLLEQQWMPGITARSCTSMNKRLRQYINKYKTSLNPQFFYQKKLKEMLLPNLNFQEEFLRIYQEAAGKLDLDGEDDGLICINEFLFVVTRDSGKEVEFLNLWEKLAFYFELHRWHNNPAYAIGLSAAKVGFPIRHDEMEGLDFFDDRIEKIRISLGKSNPSDKREYFEAQKQIEEHKRSDFQKLLTKSRSLADYHYHLTRLRIRTRLDDYEFYYQ